MTFIENAAVKTAAFSRLTTEIPQTDFCFNYLTGTLTGDEVILEYYLDILGEESREVLDCAYLNSFYHTGVANHLDQAILKCSSMPGRENHFLSLGETIQKLDELPFDYERKCGSCQDFFAL